MIARWKFAAILSAAAASFGCSSEAPRAPLATVRIDRTPRAASVEEAKSLEATSPLRVKLTSVRGAELYVPAWFSPKNGGYDLIVHFHGLGKIQEANIERAKLNVAVVSVNLGAGTEPYSAAFRKPVTFPRLLAEAEAEIESAGRARGARRRRLALSAWSAGYVSVAKIMRNPEVAQKVDAVLLADGFFTSFTNAKRRQVNEQGIQPFAKLAEAAARDEKLFAITHTTIPTGPYPSVQECVAKLLDMAAMPKVAQPAVGPRDMQQIYAVDRGSFHVHGYEGQTASDHVKQIHAMGETIYPYLKARWDRDDAAPRGDSGTSAAGRAKQ